MAKEDRHHELASKYGIDPEFLEPRFDLSLFKVVINKDVNQAAAFAEKLMEVDVNDNQKKTVLFSDGSVGHGNQAISSTGIAYKLCHGAHSGWMLSSAAILGKCDSTLAETTAINLALGIAATELEKQTRQSPTGDMETNDAITRQGKESADDKLSKIYIISDSQSCLGWIDMYLKANVFLEKEKTAKYLAHPCYPEMARQLRRLSILKAQLEIHWIKGHSGIPGNSLADNRATGAAKQYLMENDPLPAANLQYQVIPMPAEMDREKLFSILQSCQAIRPKVRKREPTSDPGRDKDVDEDENPVPRKKRRVKWKGRSTS